MTARNVALALHRDFITPAQHSLLAAVALRKLDRTAGRTFHPAHFDTVIANYRECSVSSWDRAVRSDDEQSTMHAVLERMREVAAAEDSGHTAWLHPHLLELRGDGYIDYHVDNLLASGNTIAVLSLLSGREVHLRPKEGLSKDLTKEAVGPTKEAVGPTRIWIPQRSLYIMHGASRYDYEHAVPLLDPNASIANFPEHCDEILASAGKNRISLMLRNAPP